MKHLRKTFFEQFTVLSLNFLSLKDTISTSWLTWFVKLFLRRVRSAEYCTVCPVKVIKCKLVAPEGFEQPEGGLLRLE